MDKNGEDIFDQLAALAQQAPEPPRANIGLAFYKFLKPRLPPKVRKPAPER